MPGRENVWVNWLPTGMMPESTPNPVTVCGALEAFTQRTVVPVGMETEAGAYPKLLPRVSIETVSVPGAAAETGRPGAGEADGVGDGVAALPVAVAVAVADVTAGVWPALADAGTLLAMACPLAVTDEPAA